MDLKGKSRLVDETAMEDYQYIRSDTMNKIKDHVNSPKHK